MNATNVAAKVAEDVKRKRKANEKRKSVSKPKERGQDRSDENREAVTKQYGALLVECQSVHRDRDE